MQVDVLYKREVERFVASQPRSMDLYRRAYRSMPEGVPSGTYAFDPFPLAVARGSGAYVWDIDGHEYVDYHNGFGVSIFGHAHPAIVSAVSEQMSRGAHFGSTTEIAERWAAHLCRRFGLSWIRFATSGTEAISDAVRLARGFTGRTRIAKIEGCYHGSSEMALVSNPFEEVRRPLRAGEMPTKRLASLGLSRATRDVVVAPFNDLARAETLLRARDVAAFILEPILFNVGAIFPEDGYLASLRELCDRYGTLLIFDEVKTGVTVAWSGAEQLFDVRPDIKVLGKGIGGGLAVGAIGDCRGDLRPLIEDWRVPHIGTFSGNPLVAAAGLAGLEEVLVPDAYRRLDEHLCRLAEGFRRVIEQERLPAYFIGAGAKGCVVWSPERLRDFRDYCRSFNGDLAALAWFYLINRGVFLAPGQDEQLTFSVAHGPKEADQLLTTFAELASELTNT
jgi:glutamate-1-semialdehyde 2,1-aminomutase